MSRAYLCVSVDTESDRERGGEPRHPRAFEGITDGVVRRLHPLLERFGAKPTYLLSPEVLRDPASVDTFRTLAASSELGTHLETDGTAPTPEHERDALTEVTDLFIRAFGHQPQSFRGGRSGLGPSSLGILASLGYAVDASVTPHVGSDAPSQPYAPDAGDPGRRGDSTVLEVPITIRRSVLHAVPGLGRRVGARWLSPARSSAAALVRIAQDELAAARRRAPAHPVILHAVLSNVELVPRASPRPANEEDARIILDRLRALLAFARREAIGVVGLGDVPAILAAAGPDQRPD